MNIWIKIIVGVIGIGIIILIKSGIIKKLFGKKNHKPEDEKN